MTDAERLARVALSRLAEPGDSRMSRLVSDLGAETVHQLLIDERELDGVRSDLAQRLAGLDPARDLGWAADHGVRFVAPGDAEWPSRLDDLAHVDTLQDRGGVPLGLWVKGRIGLETPEGSVAVVGSRSSTSYGASVAREIAGTVARAGVTVVSGAAAGIDAEGHLGALAAGGPTVAVLASGVDRPYPLAHASLLDYIAEEGAVISEAAPGCSPTRIRFLARNRIIAALGNGTVVVEAALRSGALNTANWTERLNRHLMAVPGPVTSAPSQGAHQLLRGGASLVTNGDEVLELIGRPGHHLIDAPRGPTRSRDKLSIRDQQVLDAVPKTRPAAADSIARIAGIKLLDTQAALRRLREKGLVEHFEDGWMLHESALV